LQHAHGYVKPHIALIGDAAHVVHPLAGQGVNLGLLDAAALAEVLLDAATEELDIGSTKVLRRYERWRKGENMLMLGVMDSFKRLFGSPLLPVRLLRNAGLDLTNAVGPVKNLIARRAMGLEGDLPRLAEARGGF
jgi:2-octaprenylphenol hydroxylase